MTFLLPRRTISAGFSLAHDGEAEHLLIEVDGALQVGDVDADMIDVGGLEVDGLLGGSGGAPGSSQHRETLRQLAAGKRALFEAG